MKFEINKEELEEMICCIVDCGLNRDEACKYAMAFIGEDIEEAEIDE